MPVVPLEYMPTGHKQGDWGYVMDKLWAPYFGGRTGRFWAASGMAPVGEDVSEDYAVVHSDHGVLGDCGMTVYTTEELRGVRAVEFTQLRQFKGLFTLSEYYANRLRTRLGLCNVLGVLPYPVMPGLAPTSFVQRNRVAVNQRMSEEKAPLLVMRLAERLPEYQFVFTGASRPSGGYKELYASMLEVAPPNVSFKELPTKGAYYEFLAASSCGLSTTFQDNFGVAAVETQMCGRPYVAPRMFAFPEMVPKKWMYEPWALNQIAHRIRASSLVEAYHFERRERFSSPRAAVEEVAFRAGFTSRLG